MIHPSNRIHPSCGNLALKQLEARVPSMCAYYHRVYGHQVTAESSWRGNKSTHLRRPAAFGAHARDRECSRDWFKTSCCMVVVENGPLDARTSFQLMMVVTRAPLLPVETTPASR